MELLVRQIRLEARGVVSVTFSHPDGIELPEWEPGAHLEVHLPSGLIRQYSLCGRPEQRNEYRIAVLRESGGRGGSDFMHDGLRVGESLEIGGPKNHFHFAPGERLVFIAGGIGITPLLPMIRAAHREGADWVLWYGGRTRASMAFLEELGEIDQHRVHLRPSDEIGRIDLDEALANPETGGSVYCCGPVKLIEEVEQRCAASWPSGSLHIERFVAPAAPASTEELSEGGPGEFDVVAQISGVEVHVTEDISIMEALENAGIKVPFSCREGICGSCEVDVVDGVPLHRDLVLTDQERVENKTMMMCISRSKTARLTLDI